MEWADGSNASSSDASYSPAAGGRKQEQQSQGSAGPVMKGDKADSNDPGKVSKPSDPVEFKVPEKEYSMEEVAKHNQKDDLWIVVKGIVLDVTNWLDEHPGGPQALFSHMGKDASEGLFHLSTRRGLFELTLLQSSRCCTTMRSSLSMPPVSLLDVSRARNHGWRYSD